MKEETATAFLPAADLYRPPAREQVERRRGRGVAAWLVGLSFTGDVLATVAGLLAGFGMRFHTPVSVFGRTTDGMPLALYRGHILFLSVTLLLILFYNDLYASGRPQRLRKVNAIIVMSAFLWFLGNLGLSFELNTQPIVSRLFLACAFVCTAGTLMLWRWTFDQVLALPAVAVLLERRILFVGWSEQAIKMFAHIVSDAKHPYRIVGCVPSVHGSFDVAPPASVRQLGDYAELRGVLAEHAIDIAIVADLNPTQGSLRDMVTVCEKEIVHLQVVPSCFQVLCSGLHMETTSGVPVLGISRLPLDSPWHQMLKRAIDIVGAVVGLLLSAPLIAVFCAIVYLESPGPVFFRQRRLGLGGKPFYIVKIRSMRIDAEKVGPGFTSRNDPRRLKIGTLMRSWNIDEVPQFWNVLLGDMSLVGPRPELEKMIVSLKEEVPHYNARHGVKPGLTGWAQVNGFRGDTDLTERIKCDLFYMENWNLLLDVQIMLMTFFTRRNAM